MKKEHLEMYARGFCEKCAEAGVDPEKLMKLAAEDATTMVNRWFGDKKVNVPVLGELGVGDVASYMPYAGIPVNLGDAAARTSEMFDKDRSWKERGGLALRAGGNLLLAGANAVPGGGVVGGFMKSLPAVGRLFRGAEAVATGIGSKATKAVGLPGIKGKPPVRKTSGGSKAKGKKRPPVGTPSPRFEDMKNRGYGILLGGNALAEMGGSAVQDYGETQDHDRIREEQGAGNYGGGAGYTRRGAGNYGGENYGGGAGYTRR